MDDDEINSSDVELPPVPLKGSSGRNPGQASIALIIEHAAADRLNTKRTIKSLQFGHVPRKSVAQPFDGDDLLRFFDCIIAKVKPHSRDKSAPWVSLITNAFRIFLDYGTFTYSQGYSLTKRGGAQFQTFVDDAVKAGRLIKGLQKPKLWLNTRPWLVSAMF
ncbi:MAG: hypothetical protein M1816_005629 [Peltula sp. TS41687]|nr:MAG: hypothetical protein M1816_005629 [Peltula sp. TS41687]